MYEKSLLSIVIVGYNHSKFAGDSITAIKKISYRPIELIILDDGSIDNSKENLQNLTKDLPYPVQLIFQEHSGNIGSNFNRCIEKSNGEFIILISLDDILIPEAVDSSLSLMKGNINIGLIISTRIMFFDNEVNNSKKCQILTIDKYNHLSPQDGLDIEFNEIGSYYIQNAIFRRKLIKIVGGFDDDLQCDDIVLRTKIYRHILNNADFNLTTIQSPLCFYRQHSNNVSKNAPRQVMAVSQYLEKYWKNFAPPNLLVKWCIYAIKSFPIYDLFYMFCFNDTTRSLLKDKSVQEALIDKLNEYLSVNTKKALSEYFNNDILPSNSHNFIEVLKSQLVAEMKSQLVAEMKSQLVTEMKSQLVAEMKFQLISEIKAQTVPLLINEFDKSLKVRLNKFYNSHSLLALLVKKETKDNFKTIVFLSCIRIKYKRIGSSNDK